jgi:hypothetical protein
MRDVLQDLWIVAGWIWLDLPSAALVINGELRFRRWGVPRLMATADGSISFSWAGDYFDSSQSDWAMELFQFMVVHVVFFNGGG